MKSKNSFEEAYALILDEIIKGTLRPGEVITEVDLAERYGISRTPVREALNRFQCEGLVNTTNRTKRIYSLTVHDLEEIFELKKLIEGNVAKCAAENLTDRGARELRRIIGSMKQLSDISPENETDEKKLLESWLGLDSQFHEVIFELAGNKRAEQYIHKLNLQWHRLNVGLIAIEGRITKAIAEHESVSDAVLERDPVKAREKMTEHLDNLEKVIIRLMEAFGYATTQKN